MSGRSVVITCAFVGQGSAALALVGRAKPVARTSTHDGAKRQTLVSEYFDISAFHGRDLFQTRLGSRLNLGPKVSFASLLRWGTEPEGWYVDLPYAI
jgi:hypothetical protein